MARTLTQNAQRTQASRLVSSQDEPRIGGDTTIASQLQGDNAAQICVNISATKHRRGHAQKTRTLTMIPTRLAANINRTMN